MSYRNFNFVRPNIKISLDTYIEYNPTATSQKVRVVNNSARNSDTIPTTAMSSIPKMHSDTLHIKKTPPINFIAYNPTATSKKITAASAAIKNAPDREKFFNTQSHIEKSPLPEKCPLLSSETNVVSEENSSTITTLIAEDGSSQVCSSILLSKFSPYFHKEPLNSLKIPLPLSRKALDIFIRYIYTQNIPLENNLKIFFDLYNLAKEINSEQLLKDVQESFCRSVLLHEDIFQEELIKNCETHFIENYFKNKDIQFVSSGFSYIIELQDFCSLFKNTTQALTRFFLQYIDTIFFDINCALPRIPEEYMYSIKNIFLSKEIPYASYKQLITIFPRAIFIGIQWKTLKENDSEKNSFLFQLLYSMKLFEKENYTKITPLLKNLLELDPHNFRAHLLMGVSLSTENIVASIPFLQTATLLADDSTVAHAALGIALQRFDRFQEAIEPLKKASTLSSHNADLYTHLAISYWKIKDFDQALFYIKKALTISPQSHKLLLLHPSLLYEHGDYDEALKYTPQLLELYPNFSSSYLITGKIFLKLNDPSTAKTLLEYALPLEKDHAFINKYLGVCHYLLEEPQKALYNVLSSMKSDLHSPFSFSLLSAILIDLERYDEAEYYLEYTQDLSNDEYRESILEIALERLDKKQTENSQNILHTIIKTTLLRHLKKHEEAFDTIRSIEPDQHVKINRERGFFFLHNNEYSLAKQYFERHLESNPEDYFVQKNMLSLYESLGNYEENLREARILRKEANNIILRIASLFSELDLKLNVQDLYEHKEKLVETYLTLHNISYKKDALTYCISLKDFTAIFTKEDPKFLSFLIQYIQKIDVYAEIEALKDISELYRNHISSISVNIKASIDQYKSLLTYFPQASILNIPVSLFKTTKDHKSDAFFHTLFAMALSSELQFSKAMRQIEKALNLSPNLFMANCIFATILIKLQDPKALEQIEKTHALNPTSNIVYRLRAFALGDNNHYELAIEEFQKLVTTNNDPLLQLTLAQLLFSQKRYQESLVYFNKVIEVDPDKDLAYECVGLILYNLKQYKKAAAHFKIAQEIAPENKRAPILVGMALLHLKQYVRAEEWLRRTQSDSIELFPPRFHEELQKTSSKLLQEIVDKFHETHPIRESILKSFALLKFISSETLVS